MPRQITPVPYLQETQSPKQSSSLSSQDRQVRTIGLTSFQSQATSPVAVSTHNMTLKVGGQAEQGRDYTFKKAFSKWDGKTGTIFNNISPLPHRNISYLPTTTSLLEPNYEVCIYF